MSCFRITKTNDNGSLLFAKLNMIVKDEALSDELYKYFDVSEEDSSFKKIFGDYVTDYKSGLNAFKDRVDENGEPKLFFNPILNKHYFKDIDNEPVYYPYTRQGLGKVMSINDVKSFAKVLALKFFEANLEFDFSSMNFTQREDSNLTTFIKEFLNAKIDELNGSKNIRQKIKGKQLAQTTEDINEWATEVKDFYRTLKLDYIDIADTNQIELEEEEMRGEVARVESFLKEAKTNVSNNIKLFISLITTSELNNFNEFEFVDFNDIYSTLNKTLANIIPTLNEDGQLEDIYDLYLDEIEKLSVVKPYFKELHDRLKDVRDEQFKNQFVVAFHLHKNNFLGSEFFKDNKGNIEYIVRNLSEIGTRKSSILNQWKYNLEQKKLTKANFATTHTEITNLVKSFQSSMGKITTEKQFNEFKAATERILEGLGIKFTTKGFEFLLNNLSLDEKSFTQRKEKLKDTLIGMAYAAYAAKEANESNFNVFANQNIFRQLAEAEAFFMKEGTDASIFTLGKTKWNYSLPSYLDIKVAEWKKNPEALLALYNSSEYNQGSYYMKYLLALDVSGIDENRRKTLRQERINNIDIGIFNSVQQRNDASNAADNKSLSQTDAIVDYINKILGVRKTGGKTYHKTALAADKSTEYQINYGVEDIKTKARKRGDLIEVEEIAIDILYDYFKSEYARIAKVYEEIEQNEDLIINYHTGKKNGLKSQLFPSLSIDFDANGKVILPTALQTDLYDVEGKPLYENLDAIEDQIKPFIEKQVSTGITNSLKTLTDNQILVFDKLGKLQNNAIDSEIYNSYKSATVTSNQIAIELAADIYINSIISQVEYSKIFSGDVAYYKDNSDYKKRVPETYTDGLYMRLLPGEEHFNISTIDGVYMAAPSLENLKEFLDEKAYKHYERVNATDAQAWITPQRWKFIMERIGKFDSQRSAIYKKMFQANPVFTEKELKLLAQPLKGVYFERTENGIPVFLKYSQAVLLPNLIKGTQLETLYNKMTQDDKGNTLPYEDQIQELITEDGIKVGSTQTKRTHDENGDILSSGNINLNKIILKNSGWKLQQDLPIKGIKPTDIGSQIQVNIFQGLVYNPKTKFDINGKELSNIETIEYLNSLIGTLSNFGLQKVLKQFGVDKDNNKITNESALYSSLIKQLKKRNDVPSNFIKALEAGLSPYGIPGSFNMFQNVFSSAVNKEIIKIKTNGGGFIQMADYGISYEKSKKQGIKFTPWFTKDKTSAKLHTPEIRVNKDGKKVLIPGAVFISGSFIAKYIPNYRSFNSKELFGEYNEETGRYEGGKIDQDILMNLIGYRIPNQALPSNDALMIAGILPEEMGDTIIPYTGMTAKTGSDFDIDKMYLMMAAFTAKYGKSSYKKAEKFILDSEITIDEIKEELTTLGHTGVNSLESDQTIKDIFIEDVLLNGDPIESDFAKDFQPSLDAVDKLVYDRPILDENKVELPLYSQPLGVIQNKLIEAYKSILLNKDVINDVMNSIDLQHLKDDIKNLVPDAVSQDLEDFNAFADIELKQQFALGKAGLGQNVNAAQDAVRGAMANVSLNGVYLGWGNTTVEGDTLFDRESSAELSEKDLKGYVKSYNKNLPKEEHITLESVKHLQKLSLNETMMVMINAFVDIAKDPYIVKGNWVTQTNNTGFMLLRAGVHPFYVNAFLSQPVLREYVKFKNNMESQTIEDTSDILPKFKLQKALESLDQEATVSINGKTIKIKHAFRSVVNYDRIRWVGNKKGKNYNRNILRFKVGIKEDLTKLFNLKKTDKNVDIDTLVDMFVETYQNIFDVTPFTIVDLQGLSLEKLRNQIKDDSEMDVQIGILDLFDSFKDPAKALANGTKASRITVEGKGKNINSLIIAKNRIDNILSKEEEVGELVGFLDKLIFNGKDTMLNSYKNNSIDAIYKVMRANPKYFLSASNSVVSTFNAISQSVYGSSLESSELGDKLEKSYYSYIMSGFTPLQTTTEERRKLLDELPTKIFELKKNSTNQLIQELVIKEGNTDIKYFVSMPNLRKTVSLKNTLTDAWSELLETNPEIAEDLIKYSYTITGFNNSINQFHEFIPYEWFNKNRFNSYLKRVDPNKIFIDENFIDQFFRNNYADNSLVKRVFIGQIDKTKSGDRRTTYTLKEPGVAPFFTKMITEDEFSGEQFIKYFKLVGYENGKGVYARTSLLGGRDKTGNTVTEYDITVNSNKTTLKSVLKVNKVNPKSYNLNLLKSIKNREDLVKTYDASSIVSEETIQEKEINTPVIIKDQKVDKVVDTKLEQVKTIFAMFPELSKIGTVEEYSQYLDTIFPNSQFNDIVFHGTGSAEKFDKFVTSRDRLYFSDLETAGRYSAWDTDNREKWAAQNNETVATNPRIIGAILNMENPTRLDGVKFEETETNKEGDSIIGTNIQDPLGGVENQYVVRKAEQAFILGTKEDMDGFKEFKISAEMENPLPNSGKVINIYAGTGENAQFSNLYHKPFVDNGITDIGHAYNQTTNKTITWNTVEGAFQAEKLVYADDAYWSKEDSTLLSKLGIELIEKLAKSNGGTAKKLGRSIKGLKVEEWDENAYSAMSSLVYFNLLQHPDILKQLLDTGLSTLTHTQDKTRWGKEFPQILMDIRNGYFKDGYFHASSNLYNNDGSIKYAATTKQGIIKINTLPLFHKEGRNDFFNYLEGLEGKSSIQKKEVIRQVAEHGFSFADIKNILNSADKIIKFLLLHEQDHIKNNDKDVYWKNGKDLMTPDKIKIEVRATVNALIQLTNSDKQLLENKQINPNQLDLFDKPDPFKC